MNWFRPEWGIIGALVGVLIVGLISEAVQRSRASHRLLKAQLIEWKRRALRAEEERDTIAARDEAKRCHAARIREERAEYWEAKFEESERQREADNVAWDRKYQTLEKMMNQLWPKEGA